MRVVLLLIKDNKSRIYMDKVKFCFRENWPYCTNVLCKNCALKEQYDVLVDKCPIVNYLYYVRQDCSLTGGNNLFGARRFTVGIANKAARMYSYRKCHALKCRCSHSR